jgi:hypothetical protein
MVWALYAYLENIIKYEAKQENLWIYPFKKEDLIKRMSTETHIRHWNVGKFLDCLACVGLINDRFYLAGFILLKYYIREQANLVKWMQKKGIFTKAKFNYIFKQIYSNSLHLQNEFHNYRDYQKNIKMWFLDIYIDPDYVKSVRKKRTDNEQANLKPELSKKVAIETEKIKI